MGTVGGFAFPVHQVSILKPFGLGRREVIVDEWDARFIGVSDLSDGIQGAAAK